MQIVCADGLRSSLQDLGGGNLIDQGVDLASAMRRLARSCLEGAGKMIRTEVYLVRQSLDGKRLAKVRVDKIPGTPKSSVIERTAGFR